MDEIVAADHQRNVRETGIGRVSPVIDTEIRFCIESWKSSLF
jgi:hypothetical protein